MHACMHAIAGDEGMAEAHYSGMENRVQRVRRALSTTQLRHPRAVRNTGRTHRQVSADVSHRRREARSTSMMA